MVLAACSRDKLKDYAQIKNRLIDRALSLMVSNELDWADEHLDEILIAILLKRICLNRGLGKIKDSFDKFISDVCNFSDGEEEFYFISTQLSEQADEKIEEAISDILQTRLLRSFDDGQGRVHRKTQGVFHTPYSVALRIAEEAILPRFEHLVNTLKRTKSSIEKQKVYAEFLSLRIIDPACGTGIILSAMVEIANRLNNQLFEYIGQEKWYLEEKKFKDRIVQNNIYGIDIDPKACRITKAILNCKYLTSPVCLAQHICNGDSLIPEGMFNFGDFQPVGKLFNEVMQNGGFDILVMNPPYERLKTDISSFKDVSNGGVLYEASKKHTEERVSLYKNSGQYPLSARGVLDLYKLFIERAFQITSQQGNISFIVPYSLLGDISCSALRRHIFQGAKVSNVYCIPEDAQVFENVLQAFCIMGIIKGKSTERFKVYDGVVSFKPLDYRKEIDIIAQGIDKVAPTSYAIPICDEIEWAILLKMHMFPSLKEIPEILNLRGEFDLTFGKKFLGKKSGESTLIRGNHIKSYAIDFNSETPDYVNKDEIRAAGILGSKEQYLNKPRIVGQQISNMGLAKRLKFALIEKGVVANSCNFISVEARDFDIYYLLGLFNSNLLNWRFKLTSTNNHVNNYEIDELPIPSTCSSNQHLVEQIITLVKLQCRECSESMQDEIDALVYKVYGLSQNEVKCIKVNSTINKRTQPQLIF